MGPYGAHRPASPRDRIRLLLVCRRKSLYEFDTHPAGKTVGGHHAESRFVCISYRVGKFERIGPAGSDTRSGNDSGRSRHRRQDHLYRRRKMRSSANSAPGGTLGVWRYRLLRTRSLLRAWLLWNAWDPLALVPDFWFLSLVPPYQSFTS